ncbi:MAG: DnaD domain protein [Bacilli bacterium]|nr:DnaD domain protein [Bacilli bacterium]
MKKSLFQGTGLSFRYAILDCYKKLNISEDELVVILMIDHLLEQGNRFLAADALSLKMNFDPSKIDKIMSLLLKKGFISYEPSANGLAISLAGVEKKVLDEYSQALKNEQLYLVSEDKAKLLSGIRGFYEKNLGRTLTEIEKQTINEWLSSGYSEEEIKDALTTALGQNKKTIKQIDKIIKAQRHEKDINKEGISLVSPTWDKDIEETIEIAKKLWDGVDPDDK